MASGVINKEEIERIEREAEEKWQTDLKKQEKELTELLHLELDSKFDKDRVELEKNAYQRGKQDGIKIGEERSSVAPQRLVLLSYMFVHNCFFPNVVVVLHNQLMNRKCWKQLRK